jgi:hypothetical protein
MPARTERSSDTTSCRVDPPVGTESRPRIWPLLTTTSLILILTLMPGSWFSPPVGDPPPALGLEFSLSDFLANLLLFLPFGAAVRRGSGSPLDALAYSLLLSAVVEVTQLAIPFRITSPFDLVANAAGGFTGALLYSFAVRWLPLTDRAAAWLGALLAGLLAACVVLSNLLILPAPPAGRYFIHAPPQIEGFEPLPGEILEAALDGIALDRNPVPDSPRVRDALSGDFELRLRARLNFRPSRPSLIFMITAEPEEELALLLRIENDDLVLRYRSRSHHVYLEHIDFRADGLLQSLTAERAFEVVARRQGHRTCLYFNSRSSCDGALGVGETWALYLPQLERVLGRSPLVSFLWVGGWGLAIGYLARAQGISVVGIALLAGTLWATGQFGPLQSLSRPEILTGLLGFATGLATRRLYAT